MSKITSVSSSSSFSLSKEKKTIAIILVLALISGLVIPVMTELTYRMGIYESSEQIKAVDQALFVFYAYAVTYFDMMYLPGWYVGYSLYLPNLSMNFAHFINDITETSFAFIFAGSVFGYLEAPPWEAVYVFPAMYLPLFAIIPSMFLTRKIPAWRRVLYIVLIVAEVSTISRLFLFTIL